MALLLEESILQVTLVHVLSLTINIIDKRKCKKHSFESSKLVDKPSNVIS